jgi:hypothetical protein
VFKHYFDSLKSMNYNYKLPIWGKQAYKRGYDLPYAYGLSALYYTQKQAITISSIEVGFNEGQMYDVSNLIQFGPTTATTNAYTVRPDIWVFPFMNLYGIFGAGTTGTNITLVKPIGFETEQNFSVNSYGFGMTLVYGLGPVWVSWDNNYNFANVSVVEKPVPAINSGFRLGHTVLNNRKPYRTLSLWGGVFYQNIKSNTVGNIAFSDVFPGYTEGAGIDYLNQWAETLPPKQQAIAKQVINQIEEIANGANPEDATIQYNLQKKVTAPFNMLFGAQFQYNKNWMLRSEVGFFGQRNQFLLNLNYRFPGFKKPGN